MMLFQLIFVIDVHFHYQVLLLLHQEVKYEDFLIKHELMQFFDVDHHLNLIHLDLFLFHIDPIRTNTIYIIKIYLNEIIKLHLE